MNTKICIKHPNKILEQVALICPTKATSQQQKHAFKYIIEKQIMG
jgi:hypothetical protein